MNTVPLSLTVNGEEVDVEVAAERTLLELLRDDLGLTGAKDGCTSGTCGACAVLLDGRPVASCLVLAGQVEGAEVISIEGLTNVDGSLHPIQSAFVETGAVRCGFCIPGVVLSVFHLLDASDQPDEAAVDRALAGHACRCSGAGRFARAIRLAVRNRRTM